VKELIFIGLGLQDENGISLHGLEEAKTADDIFIERYTSLMPGFSLKHLEQLTGKNIHEVTRPELEEENGAKIIKAAKEGKTVFLVPGDPFIATTHITLRIEAQKQNIKTCVIHGASIISAIIGLSGLHNYKFGKTVTIPFKENFSETPYNVITQNKQLGLHTLCLLDIKPEENRYLLVNEALKHLLEMETKKKQNTITPNTIAVGLARAGSDNPTLKADYIPKLAEFDFGAPPQSLIIPGNLHFMEAEALIFLADAPKSIKEATK
jgi:diphthine synthase